MELKQRVWQVDLPFEQTWRKFHRFPTRSRTGMKFGGCLNLHTESCRVVEINSLLDKLPAMWRLPKKGVDATSKYAEIVRNATMPILDLSKSHPKKKLHSFIQEQEVTTPGAINNQGFREGCIKPLKAYNTPLVQFWVRDPPTPLNEKDYKKTDVSLTDIVARDYLQKSYAAKPSKRLKAGISRKAWRCLKNDSPPFFKLDQYSIHFPHFQPWILCQGAAVKRPLKISITKAKAAPLAPPKGKVTPWKAWLVKRWVGFWLIENEWS